MGRHLLAAALALFIAGPVLAGQKPAPTPQVIQVGVVQAGRQGVTPGLEFVGRVEAIERVEIRARVTGFLQEVQFKEGDTVKEGAPLYLIERPPFEAAVQEARGTLLQAQATYANATQQRQRAEELVKTNATPVATLDQRVAEEKSAQGSVVKADADLRTANINLGYTEITAPITGKIGRTSVTKGNVVGPDSGPLAMIVSQDPMYVTFPVSQREFLTLRAEFPNQSRETVLVKLRFANGSPYPHDGRVNFVDVRVDKATDTITVRATVPNPDGVLVDGQFVRVRVEGEKPDEKVVVPQAALLADQEGPYVFVVEDGKAVVKRLKLGAELGRNVAVERGLSGGEQVVVDGLQTLRPGAAVVASPAQGT
jgi:membrane fusion protein (multidrug efflux system)